MKRLLMLYLMLGLPIVCFAQSGRDSTACYTKAEIQRILYKVKFANYCDTALSECQQVVMNLEEELGISDKQLVIQQQRYTNMEVLFTSCSDEREQLNIENAVLKRKVKRNRIIGIAATGIGAVAWLILLL